MAVTAAFLTSCRTAIEASAEYTAYNTAHAAYAAGSRSTRSALWHAAYSRTTNAASPAQQLNDLIRQTVTALGETTVTARDRETAVQTLTAQYVASPKRPRNAVHEAAELQKLLIEDQLS